ncbi:MAG: ribonuclease HII, partial [Rugosibacter sp.]
ALPLQPTQALIDGNRCPRLAMPSRAIIGGDALEPAISAASILAKTARDAEMLRIHADYPHYALDRHKGYDTAAHRAALEMYGPACFHRKSFAPVRALLNKS